MGDPPVVDGVAEHWDGVYGRQDESATSWFQAVPEPSLALLAALDVSPDDSVVDVGGGASRLVDELLRRGFSELTVLDVSAAGLANARQRLGGSAERVEWAVADVLDWAPGRRYDVWHDRALFHFLTPAEVARYREVLGRAVRPGGLVIIGAFAENGPTHCSGLAVTRYSAEKLGAALDGGFQLVASRAEEHHTPRGDVQPFSWAVFRVADGR